MHGTLIKLYQNVSLPRNKIHLLSACVVEVIVDEGEGRTLVEVLFLVVRFLLFCWLLDVVVNFGLGKYISLISSILEHHALADLAGSSRK